MEEKRPLQSIPDDELLHRLAELMGQSRRVEADVVAHIGEVDERRLYAISDRSLAGVSVLNDRALVPYPARIEPCATPVRPQDPGGAARPGVLPWVA